MWELPGKTSRHFDVSSPTWAADVEVLVREWDAQHRNVFFGVGLRSRDFGQSERGSKGDIVAIPGFWLDIDLAGPGHAGTNLPPGIDEVVEKVLAHLKVAPSLVIHSGGGLHAYYLFDQPLVVTDENRKDVQALSKSFQTRAIALTAAAGWKLDNTSDLARVLRPPPVTG